MGTPVIIRDFNPITSGIVTDFKPVTEERKPVPRLGNVPEEIITDQMGFQAPEPESYDFDKAIQPYEAIKKDNEPSLTDTISRSIFPVVKPFLSQGYTAASALNRGMATFSTHLDMLGDWINEKTGGALTKGGVFEEAAKTYESNAEYWKKRADQVGVNFIDELVGEAIGGAAPGIAEFILNIPYASVLGAAKAGKEGRNEFAGALVEGAKRGVLGIMFHAMAPLKQYLRAPGMGSVFALQAAGEGGDVKEIAKAFGTGLIYSATSPGGMMGLNEVRANLKRAMVKAEAERPRIEPIVEEAKAPEGKAEPEVEKPPTVPPTGPEKVAPAPGGEVRKELMPPRVTEEPDLTPDTKADVITDTQKFPVERIEVSKIEAQPEAFQFKLDVNAEGEQKPLKGEWNELASGNLLLWQAKDGTIYVANGHHRLAHAKRTGQEVVNAQILKENDGFSITDARRMAAEANIIEGKGTIYDHSEYFRLNPEYTQEIAGKRGVSGPGYAIGIFATDNTYAQFRNRKISPEAAEAISSAAPNDDTFQIAGVRYVLAHPKADFNEVSSYINALKITQETPVQEQDGLFGFNDSATRTAELQAKAVAAKMFAIREQINAARGATKRPEVAKQMGIDVKDPLAVKAKLAELNEELSRWDRWFIHEDLIAQIRKETGTERKPPEPPDTGGEEPGAPLLSRPVPPDAQQLRILEQIKKEDPDLYSQILRGNATELLKEHELKRTGKARAMTQEGLFGGGEPKKQGSLFFAPEKDFERREPEIAVEGEITRRSDLVRFLTEKLDIPIRTGRFRQKALGIFKPKEEVVRTKMANDIEVIAHEIGHAIHKFLYPESMTKKGLKADPFTAFADELDPIATKPGAGQAVTPEGFAEFVRLYVTNPKKAEEVAPRFYGYFDHLLGEKSPESREILLQAREQFDKYMKQPALQRILSTISIGDKQAKARTRDDLYTDTIDDLHPWKVIVDKIRNGEKLPPGTDPYKLLREIRGVGEKAVVFIKHQPFKFDTYENIGKSLDSILKQVEGKENEFRAYDKAMRYDELAAKGIETGLLKKDVDAVIKEYGPTLGKAHKDLLEYRDHVLQYFKDSGMLSQQMYEAMKEANKNYSPYYRVFEELGKGQRGAGTGFEAYQPIKQMKGSWRDTVDPLESAIKDTHLLITLADKNAAINALVDLAYSKEGMGKYVEKIPAPIEKIQVKEAEIMLALQKFGKWTETSQYKDIKTKVGEKITELGAEGKPVEPKDAAERAAVKMETTAKEALTARGWSGPEAQNIIDRIKKAPNSEAKTKIIEKTIEKTSVMETVREFGFELPEGTLDIFRPSPFTPKENVIAGWKKGERQLYEVHPDIAKVVQALDRESLGVLTKIFGMPARFLRAGATLTPEFAARNIVRDATAAFIYSKFGWSVPFVPSAKGLFEAVGKSELYWDWKKGGGDHSMVASMDREYFQDKLGELLQGYPLKNIIKHPIESMRILSEFSEEATRLGEFKKGIEVLGKSKGAIQEAAFESRDLIDFARKGAKMTAWNHITAFFNPSLQGTDKMFRAFKENPIETGLRTFVAITLPSILLAWAQHDDPRYKETPQWQKDLSWVILPNRMTQETWDAMSAQDKARELQLITGSPWRFPKPFEIGVIFGSIPERITTYIMNQDPHAFDGILKSMSRAFIPSVFPTPMLPFIENWANRSMFFDRAIVPLGRDELMPEYQYGPYTSETAKKIGELLGKLPVIGEDMAYSPAKIDNLVQGWTGGLGRYAMQIADLGLKMAGVTEQVGGDRPASTLDDIPFIKAFHVRFPSGQSESIQRFYDNYEKSNAKWKTSKALIEKEGRVEKGLEIIQESTMLKLDGFKQALSNMHNVIDMVYINPQMTADEKREFIDMTYMQMIEIAKSGNTIVDDMKRIKR